MEPGEIIFEKVCATRRPPPKISFKDNWMEELDSEVAEGSGDSQQIQPKSKTQLTSTERLVSEQPPGLLAKESEKMSLLTPHASAMPCKKNKHGETRSKTHDFKSQFACSQLACGKSNEIKSKLACFLEASESTRLRMEETLPKYHEDFICRKRWQLTAALEFGSQSFSYASSCEHSRSESSSGWRMGETWKDSGVGLDKVRR